MVSGAWPYYVYLSKRSSPVRMQNSLSLRAPMNISFEMVNPCEGPDLWLSWHPRRFLTTKGCRPVLWWSWTDWYWEPPVNVYYEMVNPFEDPDLWLSCHPLWVFIRVMPCEDTELSLPYRTVIASSYEYITKGQALWGCRSLSLQTPINISYGMVNLCGV